MQISKKISSLDLMPQPFEWIYIPAGKVKVEKGGYLKGGYLKEDTIFDVPAFQMAKYPITNGQIDIFIDHPDGYQNPVWWDYSEDAKKYRSGPLKMTKSRHDGVDYPYQAVSWYDSVAFCLWLSEMTGEKIVLPTEQQWQRAAQGDDERKYPWGNKWDKRLCNNSVKNLLGMGASRSTTPVMKYPQGASPYGVMDMAGNVYEWCSTGWDRGNVGLNGSGWRLLKGGSWRNTDIPRFSVYSRGSNFPPFHYNFIGFRVCSIL